MSCYRSIVLQFDPFWGLTVVYIPKCPVSYACFIFSWNRSVSSVSLKVNWNSYEPDWWINRFLVYLKILPETPKDFVMKVPCCTSSFCFFYVILNLNSYLIYVRFFKLYSIRSQDSCFFLDKYLSCVSAVNSLLCHCQRWMRSPACFLLPTAIFQGLLK